MYFINTTAQIVAKSESKMIYFSHLSDSDTLISSIVRPVLDHYTVMSGESVRVSDVTRGYDVTWEGESI